MNSTTNAQHDSKKVAFKKNQPAPPLSVELTIRMPANKQLFIKRFYCWILRSAVVFWDVKRYGRILLILDGDTKDSNEKLTRALDGLKHPYLDFRYVYEAPPKNKKEFEEKTKRQSLRNYGYQVQLYSMFLMDLYTNSSVIAYTDTDAPFILPVGQSDIFSEEGKLKVIGIRTVIQGLDIQWLKATNNLLGLPMVFDFMSYFPVYLYPSSIKNCREFITKRLNVNTFEEAFLKGSIHFVSSVNVILTYAFFYERDRYDWHLDIGEAETLAAFNIKYFLMLHNSPIQPHDIQAKPHDTVHASYYTRLRHHPLELAICHLQIKLGRNNAKICSQYLGKVNWDPFEFEPGKKQFKSWCNGREKMEHCELLVNQRYSDYIDRIAKQEAVKFHVGQVREVEQNLRVYYNLTCSALYI